MHLIFSVVCAFSVGHLLRELLRFKYKIYAFEKYSTLICAIFVYKYLRFEETFLVSLFVVFGLGALFEWTKDMFIDGKYEQILRASEVADMMYRQTLSDRNREIAYLKRELDVLKNKH